MDWVMLIVVVMAVAVFAFIDQVLWVAARLRSIAEFLLNSLFTLGVAVLILSVLWVLNPLV